MPAHTSAHVQYAPPPPTEEEKAMARWEDDGGPAWGPPSPRHDEWLRISAELTGRMPELSGRHDVLVTCQPGTRSGAPAAFFPVTAELEIDAGLFAPVNPATIAPGRPGDEERYPVAWGAMVHEAAHAAHTAWTLPPQVRGTAVDTAAEILEESRAEHAHLQRRPADRRFIRAVVGTLVMPDFTNQPLSDPWQAACAAGLILGRRDAGILDPHETEPLEHLVARILGRDLLKTLAKIWQAAHTTADTDWRAMLDHARAWCHALGIDPTQPEPAHPEPASATGGQPGALSKAVGEVVRTAAAHEARRPISPARTPVCGTRPPTAAEKSAAGQLARGLRAAAYRERTTTVTSSAAPPGRLKMRAALAREAQKAAGATPTAKPWRRTRHHHNPSPPLRVGIAVDVSGSMECATAPIASAAWILAKAAALTDPHSRTATVAYDRTLTAITAPGRAPSRVTQFRARGRGHRLAETIDVLSAGLDLTRPGTGRLLVIASDGYYLRDEAATATERITALRRAGCAVLWLAFEPGSRPLPGTTLLELAHSAQAAGAIGKAATAALAATRT